MKRQPDMEEIPISFGLQSIVFWVSKVILYLSFSLSVLNYLIFVHLFVEKYQNGMVQSLVFAILNFVVYMVVRLRMNGWMLKISRFYRSQQSVKDPSIRFQATDDSKD